MVRLASSARRTGKHQDEAVADATSILTKAGVDVGGFCGVVLSSSQTHGATPDRLNHTERHGLTDRELGD